MLKVLVVYYSLTGFTRQVAEELARAGGWDSGEIREPRAREGGWAMLRSVAEVLFGREPAITYAGPDPAAYDLVIVATPVWASHIASPVCSFMTQYQGKLKSAGLVVTYGSSGDGAVRQFGTLLGKPPANTLLLRDAEITSGAFRQRVQEFVGLVAPRAVAV